MIIVKLWGGMGNQMFQYACGRSLALRRQATLKLDLDFFRNQPVHNKAHVVRNYDLDIFNIEENIASKEETDKLARRFSNDFLERAGNRLLGHKKSHIAEPHFHFSPQVFNAPDNSYLVGYWQSEKYFEDIRSVIRSDFSFKEPMSEKSLEMLDRIRNSNSVCVNVRRGDFVTNSFHGSYGQDYFKRAEEIMAQRTNGTTFFVFSDEVGWCEKNLHFDSPTVYVSHEFAGRKFQDYLL